METSKRFTWGFQCACSAAIIGFLSGCAHDTPLLRLKSETELAVAAIKAEWLKPCEATVVGDPANDIGALLQDFIDMAEPAAICRRRHNDFVEYLRPIVGKEQAGK